MVSGLECCGLVLAVIPLVVEGAKAYSHGVDSVRDIIQPRRFDAGLEDFYDEIFCQLFEFRERIQSIVDNLPGLDDTRKAEITNAFSEADWKPESDVAAAFAARFINENEFRAFEVIVKRVTREMGQLIEDRAVYIGKRDATVDQMYIKLKAFQESRTKGQTSSSVASRFKFAIKERDRAKGLDMMDKWNNRLERFVARLNSSPPASKRLEMKSEKTATTPDGDYVFDLLFSRQMAGSVPPTPSTWLEGKVLVRPVNHSRSSTVQFAGITAIPPNSKRKTKVHTPVSSTHMKAMKATTPLASPGPPTPSSNPAEEKKKLDHLCEAMDTAESYQHCLNLLIEQAAPMIWKLRSQPRELRSLDVATEVQLESILASLPDDLRVQRWIGVHLSHSLLHLYEGPWLKEKWTKEKISFFAQETGELDLHRPYITTDLSAYSSATSSPDLNRTHGNPSILSLGIILIEIHTGKPIEHFRKAEDLTNGTDVNINTDLYCSAPPS